MVAKFLIGITIGLASFRVQPRLVPAVNHPPLAKTAAVGLNYWSGDWGQGDINIFGPAAWATLTIWHDLSFIAEGHSMRILGGNNLASQYRIFRGAERARSTPRGIGAVFSPT